MTNFDWRTIEDEREKYAAYLCSREWAVLKEAVHERAKGTCERCRLFPVDAVHHLTYERKYAEKLEDLAGWCKYCHDFTHGKVNFDPRCAVRAVLFLRSCSEESRRPAPWEAICEPSTLNVHLRILLSAVDHVERLCDLFSNELDDVSDLEIGASAIDSRLPFRYYGFPREWLSEHGPGEFSFWVLQICGSKWTSEKDWFSEDTED